MPLPAERPPSSREAFDEAIEMLRSDRARGFNIDIETDSMVFEDQKAEKSARIEFITAVGGFLKEAIPTAQMYPQAARVLIEMLMFGVRGFKTGHHLEQIFDETSDQIMEMGDTPQPPKVDPKVEEAKARAEADKAKMAIEGERLKMDRDDKGERLKMDQDAAVQQLQLARVKVDAELANESRKIEAQIAGQNKKIMAEASSEAGADPAGSASPFEAILKGQQQMMAQFNALLQIMAAPKRVVRDPRTGKAEGVETVMPQSLQ